MLTISAVAARCARMHALLKPSCPKRRWLEAITNGTSISTNAYRTLMKRRVAQYAFQFARGAFQARAPESSINSGKERHDKKSLRDRCSSPGRRYRIPSATWTTCSRIGPLLLKATIPVPRRRASDAESFEKSLFRLFMKCSIVLFTPFCARS